VIEGRNYTNETLTYMTPPVRANAIVDEFVKLYRPFLEAKDGLKQFLVIEVCAGMGGNTVAFLERKEIGLVVAYEKRDERRLMLRRNIQAYGLGDKAFVADQAFDGGDFSAFRGGAMYIDPPWLPEDVSGEVGSKDQYILSGIKVGSKTIEGWLQEYRGTLYAFVAQFPPGYTLGAVEGWNMDYLDTTSHGVAKSRLYIGTCAESAQYVIPNEGGLAPYRPWLDDPKSAPFVNNWVDPDPAPPQEKAVEAPAEPVVPAVVRVGAVTVGVVPAQREPPLESGDRPRLRRDEPRRVPPPGAPREPAAPAKAATPSALVSDLDWAAFCSKLPVPTKEKGTPAWIREFQVYIYQLLKAVVTVDAVLTFLVGREAMSLWMMAFTHETYNATLNYESLETGGDAVTGYVFKKYLKRRFPKITAAGLTEYKARYMSKEFQQGFARDMKLGEWLLAEETEANANILEDLFESFFGTLDELSDRYKEGLGAVNCYNYMPLIFKRIEFDPTMIRGKPKTVLIQYGSRLGLGTESVTDETVQTDRGYTTNIFLSQDFAQFIADRAGMQVTNPIARGHGGSKKASEEDAYTRALAVFNSAGLSYEWVLKERNAKMFRNFDQKLVQAARDKATKAGFDQIAFFTPRSTSVVKTTVVQLRGIRSDTGVVTILDNASAASEDEARLAVLVKYTSTA
ncbi:Hypothetical protein POVN_LOCUS499, partial [uncultured virus]